MPSKITIDIENSNDIKQFLSIIKQPRINRQNNDIPAVIKPKICTYCKLKGHTYKQCWFLQPNKAPNGWNIKNQPNNDVYAKKRAYFLSVLQNKNEKDNEKIDNTDRVKNPGNITTETVGNSGRYEILRDLTEDDMDF